MSGPAAPAGRPRGGDTPGGGGAAAGDRWPGGVLVPLADMLAPRAVETSIARVRNLAALGVLLAFLVPKSAATGAESPERVYRTAAAFAVAAVVAHFVRRRPRGGIESGAAIVAASLVAGPAPRNWAMGLAAVGVLFVFASHVRKRFGRTLDLPDAPSPGVGGLAWALVAALVFREFIVLPIHVPTGSMQPTIYGERPHAGGDYLGVDRNAYVGRDPRRWDVAVFDFPLHRPTEFVKRVIGLPGETVEIRDGDIWIDGAIARRPPLLQETTWREVFPKPNPLAETRKISQDWTAADRSTGAGWEVDGDGVRCTVAGANESALRFTRRLDQGDVRVRFEALAPDPSKEWDAAVRVRSRGHVVEVRFGVASVQSGRLLVDGKEAAKFDGRTPDELAVADGLAVVRSAGRELASADVPTEGGMKHGVELVVVRGSVAFRNLRVDQDQRWRAAQDGTARWTVPPRHYFVLGDNTEQSEDSREWSVVELRLKDGSRTYRAAATYPGDDGAPRANFRTLDGEHVFTDVDGVPRRVRVDACERPETGIPAPFVPRGHFLGRASFIFWPWRPVEGGFRPRILP